MAAALAGRASRRRQTTCGTCPIASENQLGGDEFAHVSECPTHVLRLLPIRHVDSQVEWRGKAGHQVGGRTRHGRRGGVNVTHGRHRIGWRKRKRGLDRPLARAAHDVGCLPFVLWRRVAVGQLVAFR